MRNYNSNDIHFINNDNVDRRDDCEYRKVDINMPLIMQYIKCGFEVLPKNLILKFHIVLYLAIEYVVQNITYNITTFHYCA